MIYIIFFTITLLSYHFFDLFLKNLFLADEKKINRGEKKFKKAMLKLGMKPMTGINRITISRGKNLLLYIDNPEILKSPTADNSYIM